MIESRSICSGFFIATMKLAYSIGNKETAGFTTGRFFCNDIFN